MTSKRYTRSEISDFQSQLFLLLEDPANYPNCHLDSPGLCHYLKVLNERLNPEACYLADHRISYKLIGKFESEDDAGYLSDKCNRLDEPRIIFILLMNTLTVDEILEIVNSWQTYSTSSTTTFLHG